jgi:hypothetical protein
MAHLTIRLLLSDESLLLSIKSREEGRGKREEGKNRKPSGRFTVHAQSIPRVSIFTLFPLPLPSFRLYCTVTLPLMPG